MTSTRATSEISLYQVKCLMIPRGNQYDNNTNIKNNFSKENTTNTRLRFRKRF
jgi:hypothetical protein